ncbi:hypothetical protein [Loigolactobacillus backii]|uniref:hypothetical protein n=1 Tax=Loigolactobacillus backii TaxID=375175 RepID=UPI0007F066AE|nr:hypothetical protein [Loigolactobacillus backii]ANK59793.1 hypothetical protein AYR52_05685 [Loigolactobacillus backii]
MMQPEQEAKLIFERATKLFKRISRTRYWITIVDDKFDKQYNFFFNSQRKNESSRSIPLHTIDNYDLGYLEDIITSLQKLTQLTIKYTGFEQQVWPKKQAIIKKGKI